MDYFKLMVDVLKEAHPLSMPNSIKEISKEEAEMYTEFDLEKEVYNANQYSGSKS